MTEKISVVLIGINGYGSLYLTELLSNKYRNVQLNGVVDINPEKSDYYNELLEKQIPIYNSIESFYVESNAELAVISTPIHLHTQQSCYCMKSGSNVLCEKPMTANPMDIQLLKNVQIETGKFLAIGFNWSFIPSILDLKKDILDGKFGKPIRFKSIVQWPRNELYYNRSSWAGKKYSIDGSMIFDSVANNATAHFLHNLLYLNGDKLNTSATIDTIQAELYRANDIETFDTCAVHLKTTKNVDMYFYASHATKNIAEPRFQLEFENATVTYQPDGKFNSIAAIFNDGTKKHYENPESKSHLTKLFVCLDAISTKSYYIPCGIEASSPHVLCIQAIHKSVPYTIEFPKSIVHYNELEKQYWVNNLNEDLNYCYKNYLLPSDAAISWSSKGAKVKVSNS